MFGSFLFGVMNGLVVRVCVCFCMWDGLKGVVLLVWVFVFCGSIVVVEMVVDMWSKFWWFIGFFDFKINEMVDGLGS